MFPKMYCADALGMEKLDAVTSSVNALCGSSLVIMIYLLDFPDRPMNIVCCGKFIGVTF